MVSFQSKWRYLFMFLGIQLVVMALLSREGYQKRVTYFIRIFRKPDTTGLSGRNHTAAGITGGDVYANLSHLPKPHNHGDSMPYCPKTSPFIGELSYRLLCPSVVDFIRGLITLTYYSLHMYKSLKTALTYELAHLPELHLVAPCSCPVTFIV